MNQVASVSFRVPSGKTASLRVDHEQGQYVLSRREGDEVSSLETFATKGELQFFLGRPNCPKDEEALGILLLQARFFDAEETQTELVSIFAQYPVGLILIGHAAVALHDSQVYRVYTWEDHLYIQCYVSQELFRPICARETVMRIKGFAWHEMFRDSSTTQLYVEGEHTLAISYRDLERHSSLIDGIRVAAKEHLLALTIDAALMRCGPSASFEDRKDLVALVLRLNDPNSELLASALDEDRLTFLRAIGKDAAIFEEMFVRYTGAANQFLVWYNDRIVKLENLVDYIALRNNRDVSNRHLRNHDDQAPDLENEQTVPLSYNFDRLPAGVADVTFDEPVTTIRALCESAGLRFRFSEDNIPSVVISQGTGNLRAFDVRHQPVYVVDRAQFTAKSFQEEALRILEVVAYSFGDDFVAQCIDGLLD